MIIKDKYVYDNWINVNNETRLQNTGGFLFKEL